MYYGSHTPETHETWQAAMNKKYPKKTGGAKSAGSSVANEKTLKISDALRTALCTNLCVTEEDLEKIISDSKTQEN